MASSKVLPNTSPTNPDLTRQSSLCSISNLLSDHQHQQDDSNLSMDDFLKNMYAPPFPVEEDDVWGEIVAGDGSQEGITLEDFLTKAGAVREEDIRGVEHPKPVVKGKRKAVEPPPMDKATQQRQSRMIKNRESAARSRERKQAYTDELEVLVTQLEEENAQLLKEVVEQNKERFKQLMENLIPVDEKQKPSRALRRVNSVQW